MRTKTFDLGRIILHGDPVPKGRPRLGRGRTFTPKRTVDYEHRVELAVAEKIAVKLVGPVRLQVSFFCETRRKVDIDNLLKSLMDGIQKSGVIDNDSQICAIRAFKFYDKFYPRVEFSIMALEDDAGYQHRGDL